MLQADSRRRGQVNRRDFLGLVVAASLATTLGRRAIAAPRRDKPNLLVLWTDQSHNTRSINSLHVPKPLGTSPGQVGDKTQKSVRRLGR